ncbi:MAG: hypothetical protein U5K28_00190 [Halobacteriales archaeon]|nr:hypothetical protein [Halobacteriales archaeon]
MGSATAANSSPEDPDGNGVPQPGPDVRIKPNTYDPTSEEWNNLKSEVNSKDYSVDFDYTTVSYPVESNTEQYSQENVLGNDVEVSSAAAYVTYKNCLGRTLRMVITDITISVNDFEAYSGWMVVCT